MSLSSPAFSLPSSGFRLPFPVPRILSFAFCLLFSVLCLPVTAETDRCHSLAQSAWDAGQYRNALDHYLRAHPSDPPADVLYNIGNCHYRLGHHGLAILHYRRALRKQPRHPEAALNLGYLAAKHNIPSPVRPWHQKQLASFPETAFRFLLHLGLWLLLLGILALLAFRKKPLPALGIATASGGLLLSIAATVALRLYPRDAEFAPAEEQAIVITPVPATARAEPRHSAAALRDLPPGTLCRLLAPRGSWSYLELPDRSRAWLPSGEISPLVPRSHPREEQNAKSAKETP